MVLPLRNFRHRPLLVSSSALDHGRQRAEEEAQITQEGPVSDVFKFHTCPVGVTNLAPSLNGPIPCHTRLQRQELQLSLAIVVELFKCDRSRPHQRHVSHQDVEELGQLVEAGLAKESTGGGKSRIPVRRYLALICQVICIEIRVGPAVLKFLDGG